MRRFVGLVLSLVAAPPVFGQGCEPWEAIGGLDSEPGIAGSVRSFAVYDEGNGQRLFVAGNFRIAEAGALGISNLARWDGQAWSSLPGIEESLFLYAVEAHDDGSGEMLFASVAVIGQSVPQNLKYLRRWDGQQWLPISDNLIGSPELLRSLDLGGGRLLYLIDQSMSVGGTSAGAATWDGVSVGAIAPSLGGTPGAVEGYDSQLYVGMLGDGLLRLESGSWVPVAEVPGERIHALQVFDDGTGERLYVGGRLSAGGIVCGRFDGTAFESLPIGTGYAVGTFQVVSDPQPSLLAGILGNNADGAVRRWSAGAWTQVAVVNRPLPPPSSSVEHLRIVQWPPNDPAGLVVGGAFIGGAEGIASRAIVKRTIAGWSAFPRGVGPSVSSLAKWNDGTGERLYVGGTFRTADGVTLNNIGARDAAGSYTPLGTGIDAPPDEMFAYDDGFGERLYVGGLFAKAGGVTVNSLGRWDGTTWSAVGGGVTHDFDIGGVRAFAAFNHGAGDRLYVGGAFTKAGTVNANSIARWTGSAWEALGSGVTTTPSTAAAVYALAVYDNGGGQDLYVGGTFSAAGAQPAVSIARFDGINWSPLTGTLTVASGNPTVRGLTVADWSGNSRLHAMGRFTVSGTTIHSLAQWDGAQWLHMNPTFGLTYAINTSIGPEQLATVLTTPTPTVLACASAIYQFTTGNQTYRNAVAWDGTVWHGLGFESDVPVRALLAMDDPNDPRAFVGGDFADVGGIPSAALALWRPCFTQTCYPDCDGDAALTLADFGCFQTKFALADPYADCNGDSVLNLADFGCFQTKFALGCP